MNPSLDVAVPAPAAVAGSGRLQVHLFITMALREEEVTISIIHRFTHKKYLANFASVSRKIFMKFPEK